MTSAARATSWALAGIVLAASAGAQTPPVPVPRPFPGSGSTPSSPPPRQPEPAPGAPVGETPRVATGAPPAAPVAAPVARPNAPDLGSVPLYPTADYLETFDAGRGQQYHLYGTHQPYEAIVAYYRNVLNTGGREIYREPAVRQYDLGRFDENRMAYPPSIVVKDYVWNGSPGYLFVSGTTETRYRTIIQVVPPDPAAQR